MKCSDVLGCARSRKWHSVAHTCAERVRQLREWRCTDESDADVKRVSYSEQPAHARGDQTSGCELTSAWPAVRTHARCGVAGTSCLLDVEETVAFVDGHEVVSKDQRDDGHELHHDVDRWARRVLERVAHRVAAHRRLMQVRALALRDGLAVDHDGDTPLLDVLLGVVPRATRVGLRDGELHARDEGTDEEAGHRVDAEERARDNRREDDEKAGRHHLLERRIRRDLDALGVVGRAVARRALEKARDLLELARHLLHHRHRRRAD
mmetsp:Transcript_19170/g.49507  ORF Transcript_19170/g.49507 Transcript_19170/m.49507 type:complete len:265 (-) Transcript_19170:176-970(-)